MARLVAGLQRSDTIDDIELLTVSEESAWHGAIELTLSTTDEEAAADVFDAVVPEHAMWFHLVWAQADREDPFVESAEYEALRGALLDRLDSEPDGVKEEMAQQLEDWITGNQREREYDPSTPDTELLSSIKADLSTGDIGTLGDGAVPVGVRAASRNSTSTYTGSSGYPALDELYSLADSFPGEAFDTTDEPRVGYDVLDPTGATSHPTTGHRKQLREGLHCTWIRSRSR